MFQLTSETSPSMLPVRLKSESIENLGRLRSLWR